MSITTDKVKINTSSVELNEDNLIDKNGHSIVLTDLTRAYNPNNQGAGSGLDADTVDGYHQNEIGIGGKDYEWVDVSSDRSEGTTYTNNTGSPIIVNIKTSAGDNDTVSIEATIDNISFRLGADNSSNYPQCAGNVIVPNGSTYKIEVSSAGISKWHELKR